MKLWSTYILFIISAVLAACTHTSPQRPSGDIPVSFMRDIAPILEERCVVCHHQANAPNCGGLNLETRQLAFSTGRNTPIIIPGNPDQSPLVAALVTQESQPVFMPPVAHHLSAHQLELIQRWIREGADWPSSSAGTLGLPNS